MIKVPVYNLSGEPKGEETLEYAYLQTPVNRDILYYYVAAFRANQRLGTASSKTRGKVSGGGRKPWRQKGTGRARVGSIRNPIWRHGGIVFGPQPRHYYIRLPRKERKAAVRESLKDKLLDNRVSLFQVDEALTGKTSSFAKFLKKVGLEKKKVVLVLSRESNNFQELVKAVRNLPEFRLCALDNLNAYDLLWSEHLLVQKEVLPAIEKLLGEENV